MHWQTSVSDTEGFYGWPGAGRGSAGRRRRRSQRPAALQPRRVAAACLVYAERSSAPAQLRSLRRSRHAAAVPGETEPTAQTGLSWWSPSWRWSLPPGRLVIRAALWLRTSAHCKNEQFTGPGFRLSNSGLEYGEFAHTRMVKIRIRPLGGWTVLQAGSNPAASNRKVSFMEERLSFQTEFKKKKKKSALAA